jgi:predicted dehydrogenase
MISGQEPREGPIGVGAVGARPDDEASPLADLPEDGAFRLAAFSDEGLEEGGPAEGPGVYYPDYNMLLDDPAVELVLVGGPLELRRDFAVRALNAGRHVLMAGRFCETALGAERVMKTALRAGLVATADLRDRDDADLRALRAALEAENAAEVRGAMRFYVAEPLPEDAPPGPGLLTSEGMALLDQMHVLLRQDVKSVSAHVRRPSPRAPEDAFMIYLPLRNEGWAVCHAARGGPTDLPTWRVETAGATFTARGGRAAVVAGDSERSYQAPAGEGFWENLRAAVREGAPPKCHPAEIVRAMKLHEAALASVEAGEAITI